MIANTLMRLVPKDVPSAVARERLSRVLGQAAEVADHQDPIAYLYEWLPDVFTP